MIEGFDAVGLVRLKWLRRVLGGRPQRLRLAFQSRQAACRHHGEADFHLVLRRVHETPQYAQRAKLWLEVRQIFNTYGEQTPCAFAHPIAIFGIRRRWDEAMISEVRPEGIACDTPCRSLGAGDS